MPFCEICGRTTEVGQGAAYEIAIVQSVGSPNLTETWVAYTGVIEEQLINNPALKEVCRHYVYVQTYNNLLSHRLAREIDREGATNE